MGDRQYKEEQQVPDIYVIDPDLNCLAHTMEYLIDSEFRPTMFHHGLFLGISPLAPDLAMVSLQQSPSNGLALCKILKNSYPNIRLILTSTLDISQHECKILEVVDLVLHKPYGKTEVLACLRNLLSTKA